MFTLTSTSTKATLLALSAAFAFVSFDTVVQSFEPASLPVATITLPTVVVVGKRTPVVNDAVQTAQQVAPTPATKSPS